MVLPDLPPDFTLPRLPGTAEAIQFAFEAKRAAESLFSSTDRLVPRAGGAVGVVLCDALGADGEAADIGAGVGDVFAGFGFGFLLLGLVLVCCC